MNDIFQRKTYLIQQILARNQYSQLYDLVVGVSKYSIGKPPLPTMTKEEEKCRQMAMFHLEFLTRFGDSSSEMEERGRQWFAYPVEFEKWLQIGSPGVSLEELEECINDD
ncbi:hypothetical protein J2W27_004542 [Variovorax boronicumulans]|uniref:hypothetical protein n=1 Tax=Variovorax boronicumulans TaxID=436515 RepID=UPI00278333A8|nr:hypothetical protein [Variovorax boronicumulans]MDP9912416.1 hypothetical protein [Variovorax boronicumulans]